MGARDRGDLLDPVGHMTRAEIMPDCGQQGVHEGAVEHGAVVQRDVQHEFAGSLGGRGVNHKAVRDAGDILHHLVELGGTDPDTTTVQRRVRAAIYDHRSVGGDPGPVAVAPHPVVGREVGRTE